MNNYQRRAETIRKIQLDDLSREITHHAKRVAELRREGYLELAQAELSVLVAKRRQRLELLSDPPRRPSPRLTRQEVLRQKRALNMVTGNAIELAAMRR